MIDSSAPSPDPTAASGDISETSGDVADVVRATPSPWSSRHPRSVAGPLARVSARDRDPALRELAEIVHAADISADREMAPEAAGLEAIARGAMYIVKDDYEALEREFFIYDALYVYCQLKLLEERFKDELSKLNKEERFRFLKSKIKLPGV